MFKSVPDFVKMHWKPGFSEINGAGISTFYFPAMYFIGLAWLIPYGPVLAIVDYYFNREIKIARALPLTVLSTVLVGFLYVLGLGELGLLGIGPDILVPHVLHYVLYTFALTLLGCAGMFAVIKHRKIFDAVGLGVTFAAVAALISLFAYPHVPNPIGTPVSIFIGSFAVLAMAAALLNSTEKIEKGWVQIGLGVVLLVFLWDIFSALEVSSATLLAGHLLFPPAENLIPYRALGVAIVWFPACFIRKKFIR